MQDLNQINEMIDKAAAIAGSDGKLGALIGQPRTVISDWRHGRKKCPPEDIALMAGVAGLDAEAWLIRATIERHKGTAKGDRLLKVLGKGLLATGAAIASSGASAMGIFGSHEGGYWLHIPQCIVRLSFLLQIAERQKALFFRPSLAK